MDILSFNRNFFSRNDDYVYKIAVMITRREPIPTHVQEFLFFSNKDSIVKGVNLLSFTELFNELHIYTSQWLLQLTNLTDEFDWEFHRSKLLTRLEFLHPISSDKIESIYSRYSFTEPQIANILKYSTIVWSNSEFHTQHTKYFINKNTQVWDLWKSLSLYSKSEFDSITKMDDLSKLFSKIIHYRKNDNFYKDFNINLNSSELSQEIDLIYKNLSIINLKNNLETDIPFYSKIKKVLKI